MTIQVTGVLVDPTNTPLSNAVIRVTSLESNIVVATTSASISAGIDGTYDFNLLDGKYKIEIKQSNTYHKISHLEVSGVTTTPITLNELINSYSFCNINAPICPV